MCRVTAVMCVYVRANVCVRVFLRARVCVRAWILAFGGVLLLCDQYKQSFINISIYHID